VWLAGAALATSGCSFLFATPAPEKHAEYVRCSRHYTAPVFDTAMAAASGIATAAVVSESNNQLSINGSGSRSFYRLAYGTFGLMTVVTGFSAIYGYDTVSMCRDAVKEMHERNARNPSYMIPPPGYGYPPPGYVPSSPGYAYPPGYAPAPGYAPYAPPAPAPYQPPAPAAPSAPAPYAPPAPAAPTPPAPAAPTAPAPPQPAK
jgi:hypothetical protein